MGADDFSANVEFRSIDMQFPCCPWQKRDGWQALKMTTRWRCRRRGIRRMGVVSCGEEGFTLERAWRGPELFSLVSHLMMLMMMDNLSLIIPKYHICIIQVHISAISLWVPKMQASTCSWKAASNADKEGQATGLDGSEFLTKTKRKQKRKKEVEKRRRRRGNNKRR